MWALKRLTLIRLAPDLYHNEKAVRDLSSVFNELFCLIMCQLFS